MANQTFEEALTQAQDEHQGRLQTALQNIRNLFRNNGLDFEPGDERMLAAEPPQKPSIPFIMITAASLKDYFDIIDISVYGIIFTTLFTFILGFVLLMWTWGKLGGGWWKKMIIRWVWVRFILVFIVELVPFFKIVPANTIFILMVHNRETKIVRLFDKALEELRKVGTFSHLSSGHAQRNSSSQGGTATDFRRQRGAYRSGRIQPSREGEEKRAA